MGQPFVWTGFHRSEEHEPLSSDAAIQVAPRGFTYPRTKNGAKICLRWGRAMNFCMVTKVLWSVPLLLLFTVVEVSGQHRPTYPHPPQAADTATVENVQPQTSPRAHLNSAELQEEVEELSSLA